MQAKHPIVLGIESSCDDTACAVIDSTGRVLASAVSSQLAAHRPFGGVVPEIASREHLINWPAVKEEAMTQAGLDLSAVDVVAATRGPGLVGCLLVGLSVGRAIAWAKKCPFHGIHHLEGHLYSPFLDPQGGPAAQVPDRFIGLVVSGGHTSLLDVDRGRVSSLAETRDDALGEVFDKVGKRLGLAYPQGPKVDTLAERGDPTRFPFRVKGAGGELFFSYSGLKSQALREIEALEKDGTLVAGRTEVAEEDLPVAARDLLAGFRSAAIRQILDRVRRLHHRHPYNLLAVSGGAAANLLLRRELTQWANAEGVDLRLVPLSFASDNAAMIAFAALLRHREGAVGDPLRVEVASRIPFGPAKSS
jgi:N6-L-threonylcarbamoyladenine synthase